MVPVILLSDGFLANGSEPWKMPAMSELPPVNPPAAKDANQFQAYKRDKDYLFREWATPGMAGFEHIIGGLEKNTSGSVSYDTETHQENVIIREKKVQKVADVIPLLQTTGDSGGDILVAGWGGTYGHLVSAVHELRQKGKDISLAHFNYINPLPSNTKEIFEKFNKIIVCELNTGQFLSYLRSRLPGFNYYRLNKVNGLPFTVDEITEGINKIAEDKS